MKAIVPKMSINMTPHLLYEFSGNFLIDQNYTEMIINILQNDSNIDTDSINLRRDDGFTPFLYMIKEFVTEYSSAFTAIH